MLSGSSADNSSSMNEREILYRVLFDMKKDMNELKKLVVDIVSHSGNSVELSDKNEQMIKRFYHELESPQPSANDFTPVHVDQPQDFSSDYNNHDEHQEAQEVEETLSLADKEKEMIQKALEKYNGKRKNAAQELGISERTLYRKIKEYDL